MLNKDFCRKTVEKKIGAMKISLVQQNKMLKYRIQKPKQIMTTVN